MSCFMPMHSRADVPGVAEILRKYCRRVQTQTSCDFSAAVARNREPCCFSCAVLLTCFRLYPISTGSMLEDHIIGPLQDFWSNSIRNEETAVLWLRIESSPPTVALGQRIGGGSPIFYPSYRRLPNPAPVLSVCDQVIFTCWYLPSLSKPELSPRAHAAGDLKR